MDNPLISIVLTTYNSRATLPLVLDAILKQNYPLKRMELIVVDGGSRDQTISIIQSFLEEHGSKFHATSLIIHDRNYGVSKARNDGIKKSQGDYILILDADVVLSYKAVELMIESLMKRCCDVILAFLLPSRKSKLDSIRLRIAKEIDCKSLDTYYATNAALIPRGVIEEVGFFNERMGPPFSLHEDIEYGARVKRAGFKICRISHITAMHFSLEHDVGDFNIPRMVWYKRYTQYIFSCLTSWYGHSYYQFVRKLPLSEKIKWSSYLLTPFIFLGLIVSSNSLLIILLTIIPLSIIFLSTLNEYYNRKAKLLSIVYTMLAIMIRTLRMYAVFHYVMRASFTKMVNVLSNLKLNLNLGQK